VTDPETRDPGTSRPAQKARRVGEGSTLARCARRHLPPWPFAPSTSSRVLDDVAALDQPLTGLVEYAVAPAAPRAVPGGVVMRRRARIGPGVDERLLRFVASEWPDTDVWKAFEAWRQARLAFVDANPGGALGGLLDVLRGNAAERQRIRRLFGGQGAVA
jgi:hypothetical protein